MREVELKAVVPDYEETRRRVESSGAILLFAGRMTDRRFDTPDRALARRDHVLRVRTRQAGAELTADRTRAFEDSVGVVAERSLGLEARAESLRKLPPGPHPELLPALNDLLSGLAGMVTGLGDDNDGISGSLDWKGPTTYESGYKVREELSSRVSDPAALSQVLAKLGFVVTLEIDRQVREYRANAFEAAGGATIRFERYPRMDVLVEVEGEAQAIELAIASTGLPRDAFTADRLADFVARFEARTGQRSAVSERALRGDAAAPPYSPGDA